MLCAAFVARADPQSFLEADLSGHWYVLIHYEDERSEDESVKRYKERLWSIDQAEKRIKIDEFPVVIFPEAVDEARQRLHGMTHYFWEPDAALWASIREKVVVSPRDVRKKLLKGSKEDGFRSAKPRPMGGLNTLSFSRNWTLLFSETKIRIEILDSLSGSAGLEGMDETMVFEIRERDDDEYRGKWDEGPLHGTFRMVRTGKREFVE